MPLPPDPLSQLLEFQWRGIGFPCTEVNTVGSQDTVQHKYPDRDGARLEGTGRNPFEISVRAVFLNGIVPGGNESWKAGDLFPNQYNLFLAAVKDRSTGKLQHPLYGQLSCKVLHWREVISAHKRDGVEVEVTFMETIDDSAPVVQSASPAASAVDSARNLDADIVDNQAIIDDLKAKGALPPEFSPSFEDSVRSIQALVDTTSLVGQKIVGQLDRVSANVTRLVDSLERLNSVNVAQIKQSGKKLQSQLNDLQIQVGTVTKQVGTAIIPSRQTLAQVARNLGNDVPSLIALNKGIAGQPFVNRGARILYYVNFLNPA